MSETTSAKEMDDRERCSPSIADILRERESIMVEWFLDSYDDAASIARDAAEKETKELLDEWIHEETERRMAEDYADKLPFRRK